MSSSRDLASDVAETDEEAVPEEGAGAGYVEKPAERGIAGRGDDYEIRPGTENDPQYTTTDTDTDIDADDEVSKDVAADADEEAGGANEPTEATTTLRSTRWKASKRSMREKRRASKIPQGHRNRLHNSESIAWTSTSDDELESDVERGHIHAAAGGTHWVFDVTTAKNLPMDTGGVKMARGEIAKGQWVPMRTSENLPKNGGGSVSRRYRRFARMFQA